MSGQPSSLKISIERVSSAWRKQIGSTVIAALICFSAWLFLWNLGASSISLRSDEVIYARVTQSILHNGSLFPLMHGGTPTFEKPPLKLWLGAVLPLLLGESNFSLRALDALLGVIVVALTARFAFILSRSYFLAFISAALLLGMPELVISHHGFRRAVLDGLLTALTLCAGIVTWKVIATRAGLNGPTKVPRTGVYLSIAALCALAVLTKSVAGLVPALCSILALLVCNPESFRRDLRWIWIAIIPLVVFIGYAVCLGVVAGERALKVFFGVEILTRVISGFEGHNTGQRWFYWWYLFWRGATVPPALLVVGCCGAALGAFRDIRFRFLLIWGIVPVALYSCASSRVPWYINPFVPFISLLSVGGAALLCGLIKARARLSFQLFFVAILVAFSAPHFYRALVRNVREVRADDKRIEIDLLVSSLRSKHSNFVIVNDALSGHTNPRKGRFNVEGIYREMLKPGLRSVGAVSELNPRDDEVILVREAELKDLPPGWLEVGRISPYLTRTWGVVAVVYSPSVGIALSRSPEQNSGF